MHFEKKYHLVPFSPVSDADVYCQLIVDKEGITLDYSSNRGTKSLLVPQKETKDFRQWDLWDHTCFEFFIKNRSDDWYLEFNFSPSGAWNAFYISSYRQNEGEYGDLDQLCVSSRVNEETIELISVIPFDKIPLFKAQDFTEGELEIGITSVLERSDKTLEFWALEHPGEEPDFHRGMQPLFAH